MSQHIHITGNLGKDPEGKYLPSGDFVCNFSVATSEKWKDKEGNPNELTTWFRVAAYGKLGENCNQYLAKGSKVNVFGKMSPDPKTGNPKIFQKSDGSQGASYELRANEVEFLSPKGEGGQAQSAPDETEIPF